MIEKILVKSSGVLPCYKPSGMGSFDVIRELKKVFQFKKIGHLGTLDPMAEGVLPILINQGTKIADLLDTNKKTYIADLNFGVETDTLDTTGIIVNTAPFSHITKSDFESALTKFKGEINQIVPKYSAVKINGVPSYKLARENKEIIQKERVITIYDIELIDFNLPKAVIKVTCSKGTYIRTLIYDIAKECNTLASMSGLIRSFSAGIERNETLALEYIIKKNNIEDNIIELEKLLSFPIIDVDDFQAKLIKTGIIPNNLILKDHISQIFHNNKLISILKNDGDKNSFVAQF